MVMMTKCKSYFMLTKPGIVIGNVITCAGGVALASRGEIDWRVLCFTLLGLGLIVAAGCASNNYVDRALDAKMERTKNRALVKGEIAPYQAFVFAALLLVAGTTLLLSWIGLLTTFLALIGFIIYVFFYTFLKYR